MDKYDLIRAFFKMKNIGHKSKRIMIIPELKLAVYYKDKKIYNSRTVVYKKGINQLECRFNDIPKQPLNIDIDDPCKYINYYYNI